MENSGQLETLKKEDVVRFIRARRIDCPGHVGSMDPNRMLRKILYEKIFTKRVRGRPKFRWFDDVRKDLRILEVKDWRSPAMDRDD
jgi:hypothetical protein